MNRAAVPTLETLTGLWTRSLIAWPDGRRDTTTQVFWLQGPGLYADLRQPARLPDFGRIHRLADITPDQLDWMAAQEGFAGELQFDGEFFEWHRAVDLQPRAGRADRGRLAFEAGMLVEHGEGDAYLEHWHRMPDISIGFARNSPSATGSMPRAIASSSGERSFAASAEGSTGTAPRAARTGSLAASAEASTSIAPSATRAGAPSHSLAIGGTSHPLTHYASIPTATAARLRDENDGCIAYLIRVGSLFMYARGRVAPPPIGATLAESIAAADTPTDARKLLDFEVAFGHIDNGGWRIERSSLPFRAGQSLEPSATGRSTLSVMDSDFDEGTCERHWRIVDLRGPAENAFALAATSNHENF